MTSAAGSVWPQLSGAPLLVVPLVPVRGAGRDAHAGPTETSLMLHVEPGEVGADRSVPGVTTSTEELPSRLRADGVAGASPTGALVDRLLAAVLGWRADAVGRLLG